MSRPKKSEESKIRVINVNSFSVVDGGQRKNKKLHLWEDHFFFGPK